MEAEIGGESRRFYAASLPGFLVKGKSSMPNGEWKASDWRWDGDLFVATPLNGAMGGHQFFPSAGVAEGSSSGSEERKGEAEKRRRAVSDEAGERGGLLTLKLGEQVYPVADGRNCKRTRVRAPSPSSAAVTRGLCQVENCGADLSNAKDYHRRHKVCEVHAKASVVMVGQIMQRFCQQCSRFHVLQEFDEGKRSCRRRLEGHNIRRRKTQPEAMVSGNVLNDDRATSYILMNILKILSNLHAAKSSNEAKDQDLLNRLLKSLAGSAGKCDMSVMLGQEPLQALQNGGTTPVTLLEEVSAAVPANLPCISAQGRGAPPNSSAGAIGSNDMQDFNLRDAIPHTTDAFVGNVVRSDVCTNRDNDSHTCEPTVSLEGRCSQPVQENNKRKEFSDTGRIRPNDFDLNNVYDESQDCFIVSGHGGSPSSVQFEVGLPEYPSWIVQDRNQTSPPQSSIHSDSTTTQSRSSSNGEAQSRTDRIICKLFDKDPSDLPLAVKGQIYDWLSRSPTDMESYIRPGCVVLTIYLRLSQCMWEEVCNNMNSYLRKLVNASDDPFWRSGWIYTRVQNHISFINNGEVMMDMPFPVKYLNRSNIITISPVAVTVSERATFRVKGNNLLQENTKISCAYEGRYLDQEDVPTEPNETLSREESIQSLSFSCGHLDVCGRGFIEVEENGFSSCFFPFIVADQDICSEICTLEGLFEVTDFIDDHTRTDHSKGRTQALEFLHEMGWLLRRNRLISSVEGDISCMETFSSGRIKWLMEFSLNHDWCAVVKKLLDVFFDGRIVADNHNPNTVLPEVCALHIAVSRKCRPMVELLLRYAVPRRISAGEEPQHDQFVGYNPERFPFRPDLTGPSDLTPLHIAASIDGAETIVDSLTNDPGKVGLEAWKNARDAEGHTPEDYASERGFNSYNELVQKKLDKNIKPAHVAIDISSVLMGPSKSFGTAVVPGDIASESCRSLGKLSGMHIDNTNKDRYCQLCARQIAYQNTRSTLVYRPVMLSMVAIAAVCVCVALIFKGPPVLLGFPPFRWDLLGFGPM